jgi:hypothetical protein
MRFQEKSHGSVEIFRLFLGREVGISFLKKMKQ